MSDPKHNTVQDKVKPLHLWVKQQFLIREIFMVLSLHRAERAHKPLNCLTLLQLKNRENIKAEIVLL